jgi:2-keto-4-pentenoate hydratase
MAGVLTEDVVEAVAGVLREAAESRKPVAPIRSRLVPGDISTAYAVQETNNRRSQSAGRRLVGRKIGLTSRAVQKQLGVDQPDFGALFADAAVSDGDEIASTRTMQARAEAEVSFVLEKDLDQTDVTAAEVLSAVAYAVASIEVVDSRIANWDISILDTIADNASSGLFVLGTLPRRLSDIDLRLCGMVLEKNGRPVAFGCGAACLGNPVNAAVWLARTLARAGTPLRAGDVVMTGALGPMVAAAPGDVFEARISGLGGVSVRFGR